MSNKAEVDRIRWGLLGSRKDKKAQVKRIECPACGNKEAEAIGEGTDKMEFQCKVCTTEFSVTFDTGQERMKEAYMLAEDVG